MDYGVKGVDVKGCPMQINFFDMSGNPWYREIREPFFDGAMGVLLVYDVTNKQSFVQLDDWIKEAKSKYLFLSAKDRGVRGGHPPFVVLLANKVDLGTRVVSVGEGEQFAARHGMQYMECSCSTGQGVNEAMSHLFKKTIHYVNEQRKMLGIPNSLN